MYYSCVSPILALILVIWGRDGPPDPPWKASTHRIERAQETAVPSAPVPASTCDLPGLTTGSLCRKRHGLFAPLIHPPAA